MNLYFIENYKLRKTLNIISFFLCLIYAWIIYFRHGAYKSLILTSILFIFIEIVILYVINLRDKRKLNALLSILYSEINPILFIKTMDEIIDFSILNTTNKINILAHRATSFAYSNNFNEAYSIIDKEEEICENNNQKSLLFNNRINYQILEENLNNIDDKMKEFEIIAFTNNSRFKKSSKSYKQNYVLQKIYIKIIRKETLSSSDTTILYEALENEENKLILETLRYYVALFLIKEKDKKGALQQLEKIDFNNDITLIQKRAKILHNKINNC